MTAELDKKEHVWLSALSARLQKQDMKELFYRIQQLENRFDRELADSILEVSVDANKEVLESWKGDDHMCEALMEIMEPEIRLKEKEWKEAAMQEGMQKGMQRGMQEGMQKGMQKGMQGSVRMLRNLGHPDEEIKAMLMKEYDLSAEEAELYFR